MINDINKLGGAKLSQTSNEKSKKQDVPTSNDTQASQQAQGAKENVELSQDAKTIAALQNKISNLPEVNSEKVEKIRQAILNGEYVIDSSKIAKKMVSDLTSGE